MTVDFKLTTPDEVDADNPVAGDLHFDGHELALVDGIDAAVQEANVVLRWWRGEWFLDRRRGVPYIQSILRKGVSLATVREIFVDQIKAVPDVARVESIELALDRSTRHLTGFAKIVSTAGETGEVSL